MVLTDFAYKIISGVKPNSGIHNQNRIEPFKLLNHPCLKVVKKLYVSEE
jgi:hypothetical protein